MKIIQNSVIVCFFITLWRLLLGFWKDSLLRKIFVLFSAVLSRNVAESKICQFVWREGILPKCFSDSIAYHILIKIINFPIFFVQWIYRIGRNLFCHSIVFRLISAIGGSSFLFVGLFMFIMLIVPHRYWDNFYALLFMFLLLLVFFAGSMARPDYRLEFATLGPYFIFFMGFVLYGFFCSLGTDFTNGIFQGLKNSLSLRFLIFYAIAFLITIMVVSTIRSTKQLHIMLTIVLIGLVIASLYGCYQGWHGVEVNPSQQDMALNPGMPGRVYSFFDNPNAFGEILVMLIRIMLALILNAKTWTGRILMSIATVICLIAIGLTYFRTGWVALAMAVVIFLAMMNWRLLPVFFLLGLAALPLLPESIINRILTIGNFEDSSLQYRFSIYEETIYLIRDYGIRGVGLGTDVMTQAFHQYPPMFDGNFPIHTHNNYLQIWVELGLGGAITFIAMVIYQIKIGVKSFYSSTDRDAKNILAAGVSSLCAISVISMMEYVWFYPRVMFIYFFLFGVIAAATKLTQKSIK